MPPGQRSPSMRRPPRNGETIIMWVRGYARYESADGGLTWSNASGRRVPVPMDAAASAYVADTYEEARRGQFEDDSLYYVTNTVHPRGVAHHWELHGFASKKYGLSYPGGVEG